MNQKARKLNALIITVVLLIALFPNQILAAEEVLITEQTELEEFSLRDTASDFSITVYHSKYSPYNEYQVYIHVYNGTDPIKAVYANVCIYTSVSGSLLFAINYGSYISAGYDRYVYIGTFQSDINIDYTSVYATATDIYLYKLAYGMEALSNYYQTVYVN